MRRRVRAASQPHVCRRQRPRQREWQLGPLIRAPSQPAQTNSWETPFDDKNSFCRFLFLFQPPYVPYNIKDILLFERCAKLCACGFALWYWTDRDGQKL